MAGSSSSRQLGSEGSGEHWPWHCDCHISWRRPCAEAADKWCYPKGHQERQLEKHNGRRLYDAAATRLGGSGRGPDQHGLHDGQLEAGPELAREPELDEERARGTDTLAL